MMHDDGWLRDDVAAIRDAALMAVRPAALLTRRLTIVGGDVRLDGRPLDPPLGVGQGRITIVGGGKAAAGMAAALVDILSAGGVPAERITGLVSVPEGWASRPLGVELRATRPGAENLPTPAAVTATREMLVRLASLGPGDVVIAVISGGGSALLESPRAGVPLAEVIAATKHLSGAGADITELNAVRRAASDVKGGGLARACGAGRMLVVVLSDIIGDPLDLIASGPCLPVAASMVTARMILERFGGTEVAPRLAALLHAEAAGAEAGIGSADTVTLGSWTTPRGCRVDHVLLGSNATAVEAAAREAERRGYAVITRRAAVGRSETADDVGRRLIQEGRAVAAAAAVDGRPRAIVEGGEAVVRLPADHGRGGRNQQTVAAALAEAIRSGGWPPGLLVASIGTDGEDGPTEAAGGLADEGVAARIAALHLDAAAAVARCDAQPLLEQSGGLVVTGPTGTNVADVRIVLARP